MTSDHIGLEFVTEAERTDDGVQEDRGLRDLVCLSSSSVPANMMSVMRNPRISLAFSKSSLAKDDSHKAPSPYPRIGRLGQGIHKLSYSFTKFLLVMIYLGSWYAN